MNDVERIAARLDRLHSGDSWHGPPVRAVLRDIDADAAGWRPIAGVHTIFELLLHMTAWSHEVRRRVEGDSPGLPAEGDWPTVRDPSPAGWESALAAHDAAHAELLASLKRFEPERLETVVGTERDVTTGAGVTFDAMLHGLAEHEAYHCGQIGLLKKAAQSDNAAGRRTGEGMTAATPVFGVADVGATLRWYVGRLSFSADPFPDREPYSFAILRRDGVEIMLQKRADAPPAVPAPLRTWSAYLRMRGIQKFYDEIARRVPILRALEHMQYGNTEFEIADPDGHVLVFSEADA
jgi:uncharacterized damage-inducible protein DinB